MYRQGAGWFRTRFQRQSLDILDELQKKNLISYLLLDKGKVVKYKIQDWKNYNTVLDYNYPCQKDTVSFAMTKIDEDQGVAVGIITRIIRQNL